MNYRSSICVNREWNRAGRSNCLSKTQDSAKIIKMKYWIWHLSGAGYEKKKIKVFLITASKRRSYTW